MKKKWKLYLIQHSHTDIGYTDRFEATTDELKQAVQQFNRLVLSSLLSSLL